jgi:hypothetical protein
MNFRISIPTFGVNYQTNNMNNYIDNVMSAMISNVQVSTTGRAILDKIQLNNFIARIAITAPDYQLYELSLFLAKFVFTCSEGGLILQYLNRRDQYIAAELMPGNISDPHNIMIFINSMSDINERTILYLKLKEKYAYDRRFLFMELVQTTVIINNPNVNNQVNSYYNNWDNSNINSGVAYSNNNQGNVQRSQFITNTNNYFTTYQGNLQGSQVYSNTKDPSSFQNNLQNSQFVTNPNCYNKIDQCNLQNSIYYNVNNNYDTSNNLQTTRFCPNTGMNTTPTPDADFPDFDELHNTNGK